MWKKIRIAILLYILLMVAVSAWLSKTSTTDWDKPLNIVIYLINGDGSTISRHYINSLRESDFDDIEAFFEREAKRYRLVLKKPVDISLAGELDAHPPKPPSSRSTLSTIIWSLKLRYWVWKHDDYHYPEDIRVFVQYFDPAQISVLEHSLGLQKGLIGIVNAFASKNMRGENNIIIAHELLHTVGATDKYDRITNLPIYPGGFSAPEQSPLFPQEKAEIMAGRRALSKDKAVQPKSLKKVVLGKDSAVEINWVRPE